MFPTTSVIRKNERTLAWGAFALLFLLMVAHAMLETARDALFLSSIPASRLPIVYLLVAGASLAALQVQKLVKGDRTPYLWNLVSGAVECTNATGKRVEVGAGFVLGVYDALADAPRSYRAVATHSGVALRSNMEEVLAVLENHADMSLKLLGMVSRVLSRAYDADQIRRQASGEAPRAPFGTQGGSEPAQRA